MKLKNVHYEYRGNDTWRIYFNDYKEEDAFRNERTDGKKPTCGAIFINHLGIRHYVEAKLTGPFSILRRYTKDPANDYFSNDIWRALVKKIEGADSDYIFDEIDLWYSATLDKCYFRICCMYGTWTESFVKYMLNSQYGVTAQGEGGLCVRRSCCGIGFGTSMNKYDHIEERIIFTVKNFCRGETDIVKVGPWTNTFIGTNKENEKEYSWNDFRKYMQKLSSSGSDIWDIEWEYDETCPMTGTEVADKLYLYLKPLAYKRLFEEEKEEKVKKVWISTGSLWSVTNPSFDRLHALTPPPVPYWINLDGASGDYWHVDEGICEYCEQDLKIMSEELAKDIKEDNNMGTKFKYIENVKDIVECNTPTKDSKTRYYRVYFEKLSDMKNFSDRVMRCIMQDKGHMCYYYFTVKSCSPVIAKYKTLYFAWDNDERCYAIDWNTTGAMLLKASANFEIKMTAQVNDAQLAVWEAALGIGSQTKQKEEKNMGPKDTTLAEFYRKNFWGIITPTPVKPTKILIQGTATIIWWPDGTKTIVKCQKGDKMDPEKGIAMCVMKKFMGTNKTGSNYLDFAKPAIKEYEAKQKAMAAARKKAADKKRRAAKKEKENGEA